MNPRRRKVLTAVAVAIAVATVVFPVALVMLRDPADAGVAAAVAALIPAWLAVYFAIVPPRRSDPASAHPTATIPPRCHDVPPGRNPPEPGTGRAVAVGVGVLAVAGLVVVAPRLGLWPGGEHPLAPTPAPTTTVTASPSPTTQLTEPAAPPQPRTPVPAPARPGTEGGGSAQTAAPAPSPGWHQVSAGPYRLDPEIGLDIDTTPPTRVSGPAGTIGAADLLYDNSDALGYKLVGDSMALIEPQVAPNGTMCQEALAQVGTGGRLAPADGQFLCIAGGDSAHIAGVRVTDVSGVGVSLDVTLWEQ